MIAKRVTGLMMVLCALAAAPQPAFAQTNPAAAPPASDAGAAAPAASDGTTAAPPAADGTATKPVLPWVKFCGDVADGRKMCLMRQLIYARGNQLLARLILRNNPAEANPLLLFASMPLGVTLPYGLRLQIDNGRDLILPYIACDTALCNARTVVNEAFVNSLKRGAVLKMKAKNARGVDVTVEIDLSGFTSVYDGEQYVALDQEGAQPDANSADKLSQAVDDLAEKLRREQEAAKGAGTDQPPAADQPAPAGQ